MKLNIVPARTGIQWVKLGIQTFAKQPLALTGLLFMYSAFATLLLLLPLVGPLLALAVMPAATLGLMVATQEALKGKFPMPSVMLSAFRAGRQQLRGMLMLGVMYAVACLAIMMLVPLVVDLSQVKAPATPETMTPEAVSQFMTAAGLGALLYLPVSLMFWHAPALVHWHGVTPAKSLFFSTVACFRNGKAMMLYGLMWAGLMLAALLLAGVVAMMTGNPAFAAIAFQPVLLLISAMFSTSLFFTFRDSFVATSDPEQQPPGEPT
jgi:hypothetical protein